MRQFNADQETVWFWLAVVGLTVILVSYFLGWITSTTTSPSRADPALIDAVSPQRGLEVSTWISMA